MKNLSYYNEYDDGLEHFLGEGEPQWFEVWVEFITPTGVIGVIIRGSMYGNLRFNEEATEISHFMCNVSGHRWGTPIIDEALRSLFD